MEKERKREKEEPVGQWPSIVANFSSFHLFFPSLFLLWKKKPYIAVKILRVLFRKRVCVCVSVHSLDMIDRQCFATGNTCQVCILFICFFCKMELIGNLRKSLVLKTRHSKLNPQIVQENRWCADQFIFNTVSIQKRNMLCILLELFFKEKGKMKYSQPACNFATETNIQFPLYQWVKEELYLSKKMPLSIFLSLQSRIIVYQNFYCLIIVTLTASVLCACTPEHSETWLLNKRAPVLCCTY